MSCYAVKATPRVPQSFSATRVADPEAFGGWVAQAGKPKHQALPLVNDRPSQRNNELVLRIDVAFNGSMQVDECQISIVKRGRDIHQKRRWRRIPVNSLVQMVRQTKLPKCFCHTRGEVDLLRVPGLVFILRRSKDAFGGLGRRRG